MAVPWCVVCGDDGVCERDRERERGGKGEGGGAVHQKRRVCIYILRVLIVEYADMKKKNGRMSSKQQSRGILPYCKLRFGGFLEPKF